MFGIHNNDIYITRGDAASFTITPCYNGEPYEMGTDEHLQFRVYELDSRREVLRVVLPGRDTTFTLNKTHTARLLGRYGFDVKLVFADGSTDTIIGESPVYIPKFIVLEG